jgi:hypothetical protein
VSLHAYELLACISMHDLLVVLGLIVSHAHFYLVLGQLTHLGPLGGAARNLLHQLHALPVDFVLVCH